ncbi:unnamed protein product, partial [Durusdinium trenchii]
MAMSAMASAAWSPTAGFAFEGFDRQEQKRDREGAMDRAVVIPTGHHNNPFVSA